jgi:spore coat polysaccharide biosynthesis predicted glycosyltransferase SpsG
MKNNNIKIAIIEEGNFYNNLVEKQIFDLCNKNKYNNLNWVIKSFDNSNKFLNDIKTSYQTIVFDNFSKRSTKKIDYNVPEIMDKIKNKYKDCSFISISGYREMLITAEFYKDGELQFYFSKQSNLQNKNLEESCSVPSIYKLLDKLLSSFNKKSEAPLRHKSVSTSLRISA